MLLAPTDYISKEEPQSTPVPFLIECAPAVLHQIRREVEDGASLKQHRRNLRRGERETGGVLFGTRESSRIRILASRPLECEHAIGPGFVLSQNDEHRLEQLISSPAADPGLAGLQALGWYHSHLHSELSLSERDRQVHFRHFAAPYQVALVIHPRSNGRARASFFVREASGEMRTESGYDAFTIDAPPPAAAKPESPHTGVICPSCGSRHIRRSRRNGFTDHFRSFFGLYPYRCQECLSRSSLKASPALLERRASPGKRPEERKRAIQRTRREILLWGGGILGFLAILHYLIRDTGPKPDQP